MDPSDRSEIFPLKNTCVACEINQNSMGKYTTLHLVLAGLVIPNTIKSYFFHCLNKWKGINDLMKCLPIDDSVTLTKTFYRKKFH